MRRVKFMLLVSNVPAKVFDSCCIKAKSTSSLQMRRDLVVDISAL